MLSTSRTTIAVTSACLALTGVAAAPLLGSMANAQGATQTLKLAAHETGSHNIGKSSFVGDDTDRNPTTGAIVGYDSITGHFNVTTHAVDIDAAVALKGGLITAHLTGKGNTSTFDGAITGGTGKYAGITGTIHATSKNGSKVTHITLTYTL
jgi:hypothetical protein